MYVFGDEYKLCKKPRKCECPANETVSSSGNFSLACGNPLKIFESDEPLEIFMKIDLEEPSNVNLCDLKVKAELESGDVLEFDILNPNITASTFEENGISFYSKDTRKVTIECQSDTGVGCRGGWEYSAVFRGSSKNCKCECPVNDVIFRGDSYRLACGSSMKIFQSDEPTELLMSVSLQEILGQSPCGIKVKVELKQGDVLEFDIPSPFDIATFTDRNSISFYSKNICKVTLECQSGAAFGCAGEWDTVIILRGREIEKI